MKSRVLSTVLLVAVVLALSAGAWAEQLGCNKMKEIKVWGGPNDKPTTSDKYAPSEAKIGIGSHDMFIIHNPAVGFSIAEREVIVYNRLIEILSQGPVNPGAVCVRQVRSAPTVYVGGYRLVSIYPRDARAAGLSRQELAAKWAQRVGAVLPVVAPANAVAKSGLAVPKNGGADAASCPPGVTQ